MIYRSEIWRACRQYGKFQSDWESLTRISRLGFFTRSCGKTSVRLVNRGPGWVAYIGEFHIYPVAYWYADTKMKYGHTILWKISDTTFIKFPTTESKREHPQKTNDWLIIDEHPREMYSCKSILQYHNSFKFWARPFIDRSSCVMAEQNDIALLAIFKRSSPWVSCQIRKIVGCACAWNAGNVFPATAD